MAFKIDFVDDAVLRWTVTDDGAACTRDTTYTPTVYVGVRGDDRGLLEDLATALAADPKVVGLARERWFTGLRDRSRRPVLAVDLERIDDVPALARELRTHHEFGTHPPGTLERYNTDFTREFRYCLETGTDPTPTGPLTTLGLDLSEPALADGDPRRLHIDGEPVAGDEARVLRTLGERLATVDPDLLVVSTAALIPLLADRAAALDLDGFRLGRRPGYRQLAGESEVESYGRVLHSPARYSVPGRAIIDRSNSFMWAKTGLAGLLDLVERSWKPIQEAGWASIGNLLTAIQIRTAMTDLDLLIPATKTQHERFKPVRTLHAADRGGFTFDPEVGLHTAVHGLDFSSLYPNIMIEHNISPETVLCRCHADREDVPGLGYNVCDRRGFIPDVLAPLVDDRDAIKARLAGDPDPETRERLEARSEALKWILVTCFGYQGYKNSKFGRIEAHEAINAHAREVLLTAKDRFEAHGWRVVHGIVDSIWVAPRAGADSTSLDAVAAEITEAVGVRLEHEHRYDWICFVPRRDAPVGALTKYFGKIHGEDGYKVRGIECRQRHTPPFVADAQRTFMATLDRHRRAEPVVDACARLVRTLRAGSVDPADLVVRKRVSKSLPAYTRTTLSVAALERYRDRGIDKRPGQDVRYVVVDENARRPADRVRLSFEAAVGYDADFYATALIRACESIVSPLGVDRHDIRRALRSHREVGLAAFEG